MSSLYDTLAWTVDEPEQARNYVMYNDGELLATVERIPVHPPSPHDAALPYANPHDAYDETRVVVLVAAPDGTQFFYVDRTRDPMRPNPAFVVAPSGALIGSVAVETGGMKGAFGLVTGKCGARYALRDAQRRTAAIMTFPPASDPKGEGSFTDTGGAELGRFSVNLSQYHQRRRQYVVRLTQRASEPLRTLLFAAPIGVELMIPVQR